MIKLIRARNTEVLPYLEPHILDDPDYTKEGFLQYLGELIVRDRQHTFVLVAFEEESEELVGFLIAYAPPGMMFTFVYQAWLKPGTSPEIARRSLASLKNWTDLLGRSRILAETRRNPEVFFRKWGFKEVSKTLELNIHSEELSDGWWSEDRIDTERESETGGRSAEQVSSREGGTGSGAVHGSDSGGSDSTVRPSPAGAESVQPELSDAGPDSSNQVSPERSASSDGGPGSNS